MKDILGREINIGDIVAHATRSGNSGALSVKIVVDKAVRKSDNWSPEIEQIKVTNFSYITEEYNEKTREWENVTPYYKKSGTGWSIGRETLVVNESVPSELKDFLRSILTN